MPDYKPATCAYCNADTWCEIRGNGKPQCRACEAERFFELVLYAPIGFKLLPWQRKDIRAIYGTVRAEDGLRQYRRILEAVAKKNGKTFMVGGAPLYHLIVEADRIDNPKAYGAAAAKDQAGLVFEAALRLIKGNPALTTKLRVLESTKRIIRRDGHGSYNVLSADGDLQDGIEPSLNLLDELHRWKTNKAHTLYTVMLKGTISQPEPLSLQITTAGGDENESPIWHAEHEFALKVLDGSLQSSRFYASIYSADAKRLDKEPEYWKSREARVAANPSHEDLGGFLKDEAIVEELDKAIANPHKKNEYLRYHLNIAASSLAEQVIDMAQWQQCGGDVDLRIWPEYDVELLIRKWGLIDKPCYAGVDASWTIDMTALVLVFPPVDSEPWSLVPFFWVPEGRMSELERRTRAPISAWADQGMIEVTEGNSVDLLGVLEKIRWANRMFELREVAFDPWNFRDQGATLNGESIMAVDISQNFAMLNEPTKKLLEFYGDGNIRHGNHPVLNWHARCLALKNDGKDNVQPSKPKRQMSAKRVDGISATVTALSRALIGAREGSFGLIELG